MISKSTIKYIQSLQHKKFRDENNVFVAEGPKVVSGLLLANVFNLKVMYALKEWVESAEYELLKNWIDRIEIVKEFELQKMASFSTANKVIAVFEKRRALSDVNFTGEFTLVLDDLQDPGNFGTIIRTADWFGIKNMICSLNTVDMYNSKVVQSTMASLGLVNIVYTALPLWLKAHAGIKTFAATLQGRSINEFNDLKEGIIIIGNESKGINEEILKLATERISVPRVGMAESLNAAVAAGIILAKFCL